LNVQDSADDFRGVLDVGDCGPDRRLGSVDRYLYFNDHRVPPGVRVMVYGRRATRGIDEKPTCPAGQVERLVLVSVRFPDANVPGTSGRAILRPGSGGRARTVSGAQSPQARPVGSTGPGSAFGPLVW